MTNRSAFDPTYFNFVPIHEDEDYSVWETQALEDFALIGTYTITYYVSYDEWHVQEIMKRNNEDMPVSLYQGKIPDNKWGYELFKNMDMLLPVIQREAKIDDII